MPDGTVIKCNFTNNQKNGMGTVTHPNGKIEEVLFIHDMESRMSDQNPDCHLLAPINLFLCITIVVCIIAGTLSDGEYSYVAYIIAGIIYFFMLIETCCSTALDYLTSQYRVEDIDEFIRKIRNQAPSIRYHIECYHHTNG